MTGSVRTLPPPRRGLRDWRAMRDRLATLWRRSLRFRTIVITVTLTAVTILVTCVAMALVIQNELFTARKDQVLLEAQRATAAAQATLDAAVDSTDPAAAQTLMNGIATRLSQQSSSDLIALYRIGPPSPLAPQPFISPAFQSRLVTEALRTQVQSSPDLQWWQSVALPADNGRDVPGILVGHQLRFPAEDGVDYYELYMGYDLTSASQTLAFVQVLLWVVGLVLVVLIGAIAWFVLRSVTTPIADAAETSAKLAAGDLGVRLPVRGEDELATLNRSFNAMADSIESQIKELADLSLVQQRFVSDVSHELRTPLTTIRLAADMINDQREEFDPATGRAAELLHAQVQRFELLLTDLLEISRYDAGSVQLELEATSLAHLAEDVILSMEQLAEGHGSDVRLVAPGGYTPWRWTPGACAASSATSSATRSSTARDAPSWSRWTATGMPSPSASATSAWACGPRTSTACSTASGGPTPRASARSAARVWACRSPSAMRDCTAARWPCGPNRAGGRTSS